MRYGNGKITFLDESSYDGSWIDNNACGEGLLTSSIGNIYKGSIKNFLAHGYGVFIDKNIKFEYEGYFENGLKQGEGKIIYHDHPRYKIYEGIWNKDNRENKGKLTYTDDSIYEGSFKNTDNLHEYIRDGLGDYTTKNSRQNGFWVNDNIIREDKIETKKRKKSIDVKKNKDYQNNSSIIDLTISEETDLDIEKIEEINGPSINKNCLKDSSKDFDNNFDEFLQELIENDIIKESEAIIEQKPLVVEPNVDMELTVNINQKVIIDQLIIDRNKYQKIQKNQEKLKELQNYEIVESFKSKDTNDTKDKKKSRNPIIISNVVKKKNNSNIDKFVGCKYIDGEYKYHNTYTKSQALTMSNDFMSSVNSARSINHNCCGGLYWFNENTFNELKKLENTKDPSWGNPNMIPVNSSFNRSLKRKIEEEEINKLVIPKRAVVSPKNNPIEGVFIRCRFNGEHKIATMLNETMCRNICPTFMESVMTEKTSNHLERGGSFWFNRLTYMKLRKLESINRK